MFIRFPAMADHEYLLRETKSPPTLPVRCSVAEAKGSAGAP